ncbi:O-antigen ligase family protein [Gorillibacterium sp. sgz5001074]|uniref:O-antigen ligase family protein n=1 Tax=Gorillibacterium sp. sgz5001074 TaxID=3446695 RepID=UPI003F6666E2
MDLVVKRSIMYAGLIQSAIVMYSVFVNPVINIANFVNDLPVGTDTSFLNTRAMGSVGHPVVLGAVLVPSILCWIDDMILGSKNKVTYAAIGLQLFALYLSYSRGSWISFVLVFIIMMIRYKKTSKIWALAAVSLPIVLYFDFLIQDILNRFAVFGQNDGSVSHRLLMYGWTWEQLVRGPRQLFFGEGLGGLMQRFIESPPSDGFLAIDNVFLTVLMQFGAIGFVLLLTMLWSVFYRHLWKGSSNSRWISFVILNMCIVGGTFEVFSWENTGVMFWILIGVSSSLLNRERQQQHSSIYLEKQDYSHRPLHHHLSS